MRILFRGKPKTDLIDWIYGCYFWSELSGKHYIMGVSKDYGYTNIEVIPETVGQYTGLTDKNGKEIFEGDIVKGKDNSEKSVKVCGYVDFMNGSYVVAGDLITRYRWIDYDLEVIGNIHDTPELLEASDD